MRTMRRICAAILVALLALVILAPAAAWADDGDVTTVRVGYYENEVFEEGAQEGAVKTGYAYEYYRKLSEYTGWNYEYVYGGYGDLYQMLLDGDVDLLAGLAFREERVGLISYPEQPMGNEVYSLVKHDDDDSISAEPSTLSGKRIGVLESAMVGVLNTFLAEHDVTANVVTYADSAELLSAFDNGELDVLAAEGDGAYGRDNAEVVGSFGSSDYYLCVNVSRPDLLAELNAAQAELAANEPNYLAALRAKYYQVSMSGRSFSVAEKQWLADHDTLRVGYLNTYLPYSDTDESGNVTGIVKDLVPKMLADMGVTRLSVSYVSYENYDDMIAHLEDGTIDLAFPVGGGLYYSEENGIHQSNAVTSVASELVYKGEFHEVSTERFSVNENNRMQYYYVRRTFPEAEIVLYPSVDACLDAVVSGEVDYTTLNGLRASDLLKNSRYHELSMRQTALDDRSFGVKIGNEGLLKLVNRGISVVGHDYAQNLANRYADELFTYGTLDAVRDNFAIILPVVLAVAGALIYLLARDSRRSRQQVLQEEGARHTLEAKNLELAESKDALASALDAAQTANRAKTAFLNNMSHDIRTPMNAIVGFTTLAQSHIESRELVSDYLAKIDVSSQHLLSLINDVLDMSRIESGKLTMEASEVNIPRLVGSIETIAHADTQAKNQELTVELRDITSENVITDKLRLEQVLLNILSNAIKFTPAGGHIALTVTEFPAEAEGMVDVELRIADDGIGMSPEFQEHIFEAFSRERTSTVSGIQGTGLGMAITKRIVDLLGGTISVTSEEGKGTEFVVRLTCEVCEEPAAQAESVEMANFEGKRVLLVEDSLVNQEIATMILREAGFEIDVADDGSVAVEKVTQAPAGYYDVVLMDIQMPQMDGYEATRIIRTMEDPKKAAVPIIAVTANAFVEDRDSALGVGMDAHLAKPYDIPKMMQTIGEVLAR